MPTIVLKAAEDVCKEDVVISKDERTVVFKLLRLSVPTCKDPVLSVLKVN